MKWIRLSWIKSFGTSLGQDGVRFQSQRSKVREYDLLLIWVAVLLLMIGLVMVYSASIALPDSSRKVTFSHEFFLYRQLSVIVISTLVCWGVFRVPVIDWQRVTPWFFVITLGLLMLVLVSHVGKEVNGSRRWISIKPFNIQPSEIMKLAIVLYAADFTVRKQQYMHKLSKGCDPMALALALVGLLLLLEPDLGAFGVIVCVAMGILFLGGFNLIWFGGMGMALVGVFVGVILLSPWRRERIFAFLSPWEEHNALGKAYQLSHSLIAFGRGEIFGVGLGNSIEKLSYLPEAHTDFIMAVLGEELGFVGVAIVIFLFYFLVKRGFEIGRVALTMEQYYAGLVAKGISIWFAVQTFINIAVNLGLLPTKGLTLPLMSYGGSGVLINCLALTLLLRIDYENRILMCGGRV